MVPTKRTNHVELSHQLNSLVHSCTVYKSRWQGTNWRLSMALASVTQISTKCLYFPCLIKKNHSFTSSTSQQTYYFKDWQYSILFDSFCMNWDLEQRERYMCFCIKKYLHTDVYTINELVQNYFPLKKENWKYLLKLEWLAIMFRSCVKVHVLSFYCTISCFRNR